MSKLFGGLRICMVNGNFQSRDKFLSIAVLCYRPTERKCRSIERLIKRMTTRNSLDYVPGPCYPTIQ
jgi:hypothetical protein